MTKLYPSGMFILICACVGCANRTPAPATPPTPAQPRAVAPATAPAQSTTKRVRGGNYHLHLPGIGGYRNIDRRMLQGLEDGGLAGQLDHYDWAAADPGLGALLARRRNIDEANNVAQIILEHYRASPSARLTVTVHSAGAGIITWALEKLPDDVMVDTVVMLQPALSPGYDLTKMLKHVRGHVYSFYSDADSAVLGIGTNLFGTIDGVKTNAAGKVGFAQPATADATQYKKLIQIPHQDEWIRAYHNMGDHIGPMNRTFAREVIAPLILKGKIPATQPTAGESTATRPSDRASSASNPAISR